MRILVVEDEPDLAEAVARGLRREGYAVDVGLDGQSAREKLDVTSYDLVTLDLSLPDDDGRQIAQSIRRDSVTDRGTVTLRSRPGAGAEFALWLPLQGSADLSAITADGIHHDERPATAAG